MAIEPIGDIGDVGMTDNTSAETLTWETATDWDNAVDEESVVHEAFGDLPGADTVRLGYPSFDEGGTSLWGYWHYDEDSGSTAEDVSGNNRDGTINGATVGSTGIHNGTAYSYDGTDDDVDLGDVDVGGGDITWSLWLNNNLVSGERQWLFAKDNSYILALDFPGNKQADSIWLGSFGTAFTSNSLSWSTGTWYHIVVVYDHSGPSVDFYRDGSAVGSDSGTNQIDTTTTNHYIGARPSIDETFDGILDAPRIYRRTVSSSFATNQLHTTSGYLESATKTFSASSQPDLSNLVYSLNAETIVVDVIGSPGTASEEIVSQTLDGATSYTLTWADSHTDFRVKPKPSTSDPTVSPTISKIGLTS